MENKSNTRVKKLSRSVRVKTSENFSRSDLLLLNQFFKHDEDSVVEIDVEDHFYSFKFSNNNLLHQTLNLTKNAQNLSSMSKLIELLENTKPNPGVKPFVDTKKDRRLYNAAQVKFDQLISRSGPLKKKLSSISDVFSDDREIDHMFDELQGLDSILPKILRLSGFQFYQSVQLIVHEKGKTEAESLHLTSEGEIIVSHLSSKKFNSLFTHFKKSKNKIFNQNQILDSSLFIVGPFLAKELELRQHNLIFIISRNGFLSPSDNEITYFNSICPSLKQVFAFLLTKSKLTDREKSLSLLLNNYPFALIVSVGENIIFKNKLATHEHVQLIHSDETSYHHIQLNNDKHLYLFPNNNADLISDLNHHQRISLLGELLNTLKHELSNPLFGLKLAADILEMDQQENDAKEMLGFISDYALRCQKIIDNFSDLYLDHEQWTQIDLVFLTKEVLTLTKSETRGIPIELKVSLEDLKPLIKTQATLLSQILFNLIINSSQAIKSTHVSLEKNSIVIEITEVAERFIISVSDTGPGISPENRDQVFRPYFTTKEKGTGLGLSICKKLCQKLGYSLEYSQNSFPGATFSIVLPKNL